MSGSYFDKSKVLAGLYIAMDFGAPNNTTDKATFFMPRTSSVDGEPGFADEHGVPFNPGNKRTFSPLVKKVVPCAVEYKNGAGKMENFGMMEHSEVKLTILDPDYQKIKGFEFVTISGQKFLYRRTEPLIALGSIDVWTVHCVAEDML